MRKCELILVKAYPPYGKIIESKKCCPVITKVLFFRLTFMMILRSQVFELEKTRSKWTCSISLRGTTKNGKSVMLISAYVVGWMNTICRGARVVDTTPHDVTQRTRMGGMSRGYRRRDDTTSRRDDTTRHETKTIRDDANKVGEKLGTYKGLPTGEQH